MNGDLLHGAITHLEGARLDQTKDNLESAEDAVTNALFKAYRWALTPFQTDEREATYDFSTAETRPEDGRIMKRLRDKFIDDDAIVAKIAPDIFAVKLQQYVWSSDAYQDHIEIERLWELMTQNVYMPRLKDRSVLVTCIRDGIEAGIFGYARAYQDGDYHNFRFGEQVDGLRIEKGSTAVLITAELAKLLKEERDKQQKPPDAPKPAPGTGKPTTGGTTTPGVKTSQAQGPTHIVVTKALQLELAFSDEIDIIQDEIVRTLQADGGTVKVEITVTADKPDGFSENTTRAVKQNSQHLNAEFKRD